MRGLSDLAGLDPSHVRMIESGAREDPRSQTLAAIARVTGCSIDWIVTGEGSSPSPEQVRAAVARARAAADAAHPSPDGPVVVREGFDQRAEEG